jgi:nucleotide-binding universal stress UspA family protein
MEPYAKMEIGAARALTQSVADRLASKDIETVTQVVEGHPATSIVDQAQAWGADFIFVGSHGHSGLARAFLGSVTKEVLRNAHCSVEVVRAPRGEDSPAASRKMLLATDGSSYSECAARSIADRPWPKGTQVKVVSVIDSVIPAAEPWYAAREVMDRTSDQRRAVCEQAVRTARELLSGAPLAVSLSVHEGVPKWRIVEEAQEWGANLIVVGSHGRRGLTRLVLGSVSEAIGMNSPCSVEVIRECTAH